MRENVTMKIDRGELKSLLVEYYGTKYNDSNTDIVFETKEEYTGLYGDKVVQTHIKLKRSIQIGNRPATIEEELDENDIKEILCEELKSRGYGIIDLNFEQGIEYVGFREDKIPTFYGVKINLKRNQKQYTI